MVLVFAANNGKYDDEYRVYNSENVKLGKVA